MAEDGAAASTGDPTGATGVTDANGSAEVSHTSHRDWRKRWLKEDRALERLLFFSDAVIAIALTLLALELPVPHGGSNIAVWHSFVHYLPRDYLTFLISFLVIASFWHAHHDYFDLVERLDQGLANLNMLCLLMIVLIPFATKVLGDYGQFVFGTVLYSVMIALVALCFLVMSRYAVRRHLISPEVPAAQIAQMGRSSVGPVLVFLLSIPIAFLWSPGAAKYSWLVFFLLLRLINRVSGQRARRPAQPG